MDIGNLMRAAIQRETEKIIDEEARAAGERVIVRVKRSVAQIAATVTSHLEMEDQGRLFIVRVKFEEGEKKHD